jgi:peroxisomal 2,4-dienoyl-CoA reductase
VNLPRVLTAWPLSRLVAGLTKLAPGAEAEAKKVIVQSVPLGRMGRKWDIAMACVFLASPAAR